MSCGNITVMIIVTLILLGLCFGSFVNALVYRLREQSKKPKTKNPKLSIMQGRSMCVHCKHVLSAPDLLPILSWVVLKGRCRYCHKPISWQYPLVELATAVLFVISFVAMPISKGSSGNLESGVLFGLWLVFLTGFMALVIYDFKWYLLPNRIIYPLLGLGLLQVVVRVIFRGNLETLIHALLGAIVGGGLFYVLFQVSDGKWIGGGDVKLGFLLGLVLGTPTNSLLMIFVASLLGSIATLPLLLSGKAKRNSHIPFGPFLILAAIIIQLYGIHLTNWYQSILLPIG